jgi:hypothetical protein
MIFWNSRNNLTFTSVWIEMKISNKLLSHYEDMQLLILIAEKEYSIKLYQSFLQSEECLHDIYIDYILLSLSMVAFKPSVVGSLLQGGC